MAVQGARIAAKMIASQLLNLETEVGRVRNFPGRSIRKCLASDTLVSFLFLT